jgi:hypothetical protein
MSIAGARPIALSEARALIDPYLDADIIDCDLMLGATEGDGSVLLMADGTVIEGDLALEWETASLSGAGVRGQLAEGRLAITGDITNANWDGGPFLVALGETHVRHIIKRGAPLVFASPLHASGSIYCEYNHGSFRALGGMRAEALINDDHDCELHDPVDAIVYFTRTDDPRLFRREAYYDEE